MLPHIHAKFEEWRLHANEGIFRKFISNILDFEESMDEYKELMIKWLKAYPVVLEIYERLQKSNEHHKETRGLERLIELPKILLLNEKLRKNRGKRPAEKEVKRGAKPVMDKVKHSIATMI